MGRCVKEVVWGLALQGMSIHQPGSLGRRCACSSQQSAVGRNCGAGKARSDLNGLTDFFKATPIAIQTPEAALPSQASSSKENCTGPHL